MPETEDRATVARIKEVAHEYFRNRFVGRNLPQQVCGSAQSGLKLIALVSLYCLIIMLGLKS
jgi:hypothetical protein